MPLCVACGAWCTPPLCLRCRAGLHPGGSLLVGPIPVNYAVHHSGTGRLLVHQLKYNGVIGAATVLATLMEPLIPAGATAIVPMPRARLRRAIYGIDPSLELARRLSKMCGIPMQRALTARIWWPRHAGRDRQHRTMPPFRGGRLPLGAVLIDDVATSGATLLGALDALGNPPPGHISSVVVATSPGMIGESKAPIASGRPRVGRTARQS